MSNIFYVPAEAAEFSEQMGTKFKFWFHDDTLGLTLFKEGRPGTGENWAEKIACDLAELLGLPHAIYQLAEWRGRQGIISPTFVPRYARLIHGNELVGGRIIVGNDDGDKIRYYHERTHTASRVFQFLRQSVDFVMPPDKFIKFEGISTALDVFVGYLLFDAWIANQDRHSENWGVIKLAELFFLAPTYDHGSSLGRQETDIRRSRMMTTRDKGASLDAYVLKARSAMYPSVAGDEKPKALLGMELFTQVAKTAPGAARAWIERLRALELDKIRTIINRIPDVYMSEISREFTYRLLVLNRSRILELHI